MKCTVCAVDLLLAERQGVEIDVCPKCRGGWLDRQSTISWVKRSLWSKVFCSPCLGPLAFSGWGRMALAEAPQVARQSKLRCGYQTKSVGRISVCRTSSFWGLDQAKSRRLWTSGPSFDLKTRSRLSTRWTGIRSSLPTLGPWEGAIQRNSRSRWRTCSRSALGRSGLADARNNSISSLTSCVDIDRARG